jgi:glycosyltransferase involved in cell wall biosynthesis
MEGTPISMLEAMASNLPVFVPRVGGIPDVIFDGENGFFLKDEINETVELISKNIDNVNMGKAARKYIEENHDLAEISGRFLTNLLPDVGLYSFNDGEAEVLPGRYV